MFGGRSNGQMSAINERSSNQEVESTEQTVKQGAG